MWQQAFSFQSRRPPREVISVYKRSFNWNAKWPSKIKASRYNVFTLFVLWSTFYIRFRFQLSVFGSETSCNRIIFSQLGLGNYTICYGGSIRSFSGKYRILMFKDFLRDMILFLRFTKTLKNKTPWQRLIGLLYHGDMLKWLQNAYASRPYQKCCDQFLSFTETELPGVIEMWSEVDDWMERERFPFFQFRIYYLFYLLSLSVWHIGTSTVNTNK